MEHHNEKFKIEMILPLHGPLLRKEPKTYMDLYKEWSEPKNPIHGKDIVSMQMPQSLYGICLVI